MKFNYLILIKDYAHHDDSEYPRSFTLILFADEEIMARKYVENIIGGKYEAKLVSASD